MALTVSVIIPTKNRPRDLEITIETLLRQTRLPDEVILIDQSVEKSFTKMLPIPLKYIHNSALCGAATARNEAMDIATGDIWLFLDDDVELERSFVEQILAAYRPGITGVSGVVTNYVKPAFGRWLWEAVFLWGPYHDDRQRVYWKADRVRDLAPMRVRQFGAGLMSFRASAIGNLRFDVNQTGASPGEDIDFCASLPKGSILLMNPKARLVHRQSPAGRASVHWLAMHAQVSNYMRQRHWRHGLWNNWCFVWMNVGYAFAASLSSLKRGSLEPWREWRSGVRKGLALAAGKVSG